MDETTRHTIKISTEALKALRILAAYAGQRQHHVVEQLIFEALRLKERSRSHQKGRSHGPTDD